QVIFFFTKWMLTAARQIEPIITVDLDRPGQPTRHIESRFAADDFSASKETCDVTVAGNTFHAYLSAYTSTVAHEEFAVDVKLESQDPPWRPATGHNYFGPHDEHLFAW
ncbi:hypothetical protein M2C68_18845, partial [Pseudomonas sp. BAgro211]|nr:hypothetical protein [Pseudomonas sp. BAgro211]